MSAARITAPRSLRSPKAPPSLAIDAAEPGATIAAATFAEPILDAEEIQGNIWPGFNTTFQKLLGLRIISGEEKNARLWLSELVPLVTTLADAWHAREVVRAVAKTTGALPSRPNIFLNVAFSYDALPLLGLAHGNIPLGPFVSGMPAANLQDPVDGNGVPIGWKMGATKADTPHVLLILAADDSTEIANAAGILKSRTGPGSGLQFFYEDTGERLAGEREHFGFRDGISQPGMRGRLNDHPDSFVTQRYIDPADPLAGRFARPGQALLWPGQFILGYSAQSESGEGPGQMAVPPEEWMKNGSFLVFRRLRQDVKALRAFCAEQAQAVSASLGRPVSGDEIAAWMVGRWPDGSALVRCPASPCAPPDSKISLNHFDYANPLPAVTVHEPSGTCTATAAPDDQLGLQCPHFAHVRKVNLRDKPTDRGHSNSFRIIRRGIPYGPPWQEGETDAPDRGLLFLAYMRDIEQFLTVSTLWMNQKSAPEGPYGHDLLIGQRLGNREASRGFADGTTANLRATSEQRWVIPTGGGFFFAPARSTLTSLAQLAT